MRKLIFEKISQTSFVWGGAIAIFAGIAQLLDWPLLVVILLYGLAGINILPALFLALYSEQ